MATFTINKSDVLEEVAMQTAYIGAKTILSDGRTAYEQIFTTSDDYAMLERFWNEALSFTTGSLKKYMSVEPTLPTLLVPTLTITLGLPTRYDTTQNDSVEKSLFSYFVNYITSKWMAIANKTDAEYYEKYANENMKDVLQKIFTIKKPTRPT